MTAFGLKDGTKGRRLAIEATRPNSPPGPQIKPGRTTTRVRPSIWARACSASYLDLAYAVGASALGDCVERNKNAARAASASRAVPVTFTARARSSAALASAAQWITTSVLSTAVAGHAKGSRPKYRFCIGTPGQPSH